jgi:hypothetical protein
VAEAVGTGDLVEVVEAEIAMRVSAPIEKLTAILQMQAESENALGREETTMSPFVYHMGFQATSKLMASSTNV